MLLVLSTVFRDDLQTTSTEQVYMENLRLPGSFPYINRLKSCCVENKIGDRTNTNTIPNIALPPTQGYSGDSVKEATYTAKATMSTNPTSLTACSDTQVRPPVHFK